MIATTLAGHVVHAIAFVAFWIGLLIVGFAIVVLILKAGHVVRQYFRDEPEPRYVGLRRLDRDKDTT